MNTVLLLPQASCSVNLDVNNEQGANKSKKGASKQEPDTGRNHEQAGTHNQRRGATAMCKGGGEWVAGKTDGTKSTSHSCRCRTDQTHSLPVAS